MDENKRILYKEDNEFKYREKQGQIFTPGFCLPEEIQNLKTANKVCIVGFAQSWDETPFDDETFDIWGINELYMQVRQKYGKDRRFTHWFEIHNPMSPTRNIPYHHEFLKKWDKPVLMQKHYEWIPNSIPIPKDTIIDFFNQNFIIDACGGSFSDYSNQISVMTAMAIMMGYDEIRIYGVDMAQWSEYAWQRSSCQFFIGYAAGMGIKVLVPLTSELCKYPNFYGFETDGNNYVRMYTKKRIKSMKNTIQQIEQQLLLNEFEREQQKANNDNNLKQIDLSLQRIDDELIKLDLALNTNQEVVLKFIETMPNDLAQINSKKDCLKGKIKEQLGKIEESVKILKEDKKKLLGQKGEIQRIDFIQRITYERAKKNYEAMIQGHQGIKADCDHYLQNNII
jgi:hypothetical protein